MENMIPHFSLFMLSIVLISYCKADPQANCDSCSTHSDIADLIPKWKMIEDGNTTERRKNKTDLAHRNDHTTTKIPAFFSIFLPRCGEGHVYDVQAQRCREIVD